MVHLQCPKCGSLNVLRERRPGGNDGQSVHNDVGLSKREYFAGLAMQALLSNDSALGQIVDELANPAGDLKKCVAIMALEYSDALLAELSKLTTKEEK